MTTVRGLPIDYTGVGYEALRAAMLDIAATTLPEWTDRTENDLGVLLVELMAYASDVTLYYQTRIAQQLFPGTGDEPDALVPLLRLLGYELTPPAPATVDLELAVDAAAPLPLALPAGTAFTTTTPAGAQLTFETPRAQVITAADLGPVEDGVRRFSPLSVVAGVTVTGEVIGRADGSPSLLLPLAQGPVVPGSVTVAVTEPTGTSVWRERATLTGATAVDRVFAVQRDAAGGARLLFGDGVNGRIPPAGPPSAPAELVATYRVGGGPAGNVPTGTRFDSAVPAIRGAVAPAGGHGGADGETLAHAGGFAPRLFRSGRRAVTAQDWVDLALAVPGVGKAVAVPSGWNGVDLYIAPAGAAAVPGELLRRDVLAAFEATRMLTTSVTLHPPRLVDVYLRADVRAVPYVLAADAVRAVQGAVGALLAVDAVEFGQQLYLSRVYDAAQSLPEVDALNVTQFSRDPEGAVDPGGIIELAAFELARPGYQPAIQVTVQGGVVS